MTGSPICTFCKHLDRRPDRRLSCAAFPGGIPAEVYENLMPHTRPLEGDGGIRFEPREGLTDVERRGLGRALAAAEGRGDASPEDIIRFTGDPPTARRPATAGGPQPA